MSITSAILISTYNWPDALQLVFKSLENQTILPNEILVADDGSGKETTKVIESFANRLSISLRHISQNDKGFRKAKVMNKAIAVSTADYIIEVDGDCILHPNFVEDHLSFAEKGVFLFGSRVNIQEDYLPTLFEKQKTNFHFFSKGIKKRSRSLRIPLFSNLYKKTDKLSKKLRGCNISFWREDILKVNGYNEAMEGWGREDSELFVRVMNTGIKARRLRYKGIVYHIWHKEKSKNNLEKNDQMQRLAIQEKKVWCKKGISQYL